MENERSFFWMPQKKKGWGVCWKRFFFSGGRMSFFCVGGGLYIYPLLKVLNFLDEICEKYCYLARL